ncbi:MAG TPA: FecR family protein [Kofleriaceae bacterium]|jgi:hypothetical protein
MTAPRLDRPPVEPFSDAAWRRVEVGLWRRVSVAAPPVAPPSRAWWLAVPILAAALVVLVLAWPSTRSTVVGDGSSRIVAGDTPSSVSFADAHVALDPHAAVALSRTGTSEITVEHGAAWFTVAPRDARAPLVVHAAGAAIRVIGTRFRVAVDGERVEVRVEHGTVEVDYHGDRERVTAGQEWHSDAPAQVSATAQTTPDDAATYAALAGLEARDPDAAIAGYLAIADRAGPWAEVSLFAAARLAADQRDSRAPALLGRYLQTYPEGANATDARELLERMKGATR